MTYIPDTILQFGILSTLKWQFQQPKGSFLKKQYPEWIFFNMPARHIADVTKFNLMLAQPGIHNYKYLWRQKLKNFLMVKEEIILNFLFV